MLIHNILTIKINNFGEPLVRFCFYVGNLEFVVYWKICYYKRQLKRACGLFYLTQIWKYET